MSTRRGDAPNCTDRRPPPCGPCPFDTRAGRAVDAGVRERRDGAWRRRGGSQAPRRTPGVGLLAGSGTSGGGAPGRNRTCDQVLRRHLLYPLSYGGAATCSVYARTGGIDGADGLQPWQHAAAADPVGRPIRASVPTRASRGRDIGPGAASRGPSSGAAGWARRRPVRAPISVRSGTCSLTVNADDPVGGPRLVAAAMGSPNGRRADPRLVRSCVARLVRRPGQADALTSRPDRGPTAPETPGHVHSE